MADVTQVRAVLNAVGTAITKAQPHLIQYSTELKTQNGILIATAGNTLNGGKAVSELMAGILDLTSSNIHINQAGAHLQLLIRNLSNI